MANSYASPVRSLATLVSAKSPWAGLENEIDRLFETTLSGLASAPRSQFPVDIYEDQNNTYVRAELPGVRRADVNVEIVEDYLTITAIRNETDEEHSFSFRRSLTVPDHVQTDKVSANYEDGVLTVTMPKREEAKPKKVSVTIKE